jgi:hypothetical protein
MKQLNLFDEHARAVVRHPNGVPIKDKQPK